MNALTVVPTGVANLASVEAAFARLGVTLQVANDGDDVHAAAAVLLPGVGHFGAAAKTLAERGLGDALRARLASGRATLGICLGMQLCCVGSDEAPGVPGLGVVAGQVTRFPAGLRVPQMGWNHVVAPPAAEPLASGHAYFANSYRLAQAPAGWQVATAEHGGAFVAALARDAVLLCQFHPELSGAYGAQLLARWLTCAGLEVLC